MTLGWCFWARVESDCTGLYPSCQLCSWTLRTFRLAGCAAERGGGRPQAAEENKQMEAMMAQGNMQKDAMAKMQANPEMMEKALEEVRNLRSG